MRMEHWILIGVWLLSALLLLLIPRRLRRLALAAFLFKQSLTFVLGLFTVQLGLLVYPIRELASVNRTSLVFEYAAYPIVCALFNVYYPASRGPLLRAGYFAAFCSVLTFVEVMIEIHTDLIEYLHWNWFCTWCSLFATFLLSRTFCIVFFSGIHALEEEEQLVPPKS